MDLDNFLLLFSTGELTASVGDEMGGLRFPLMTFRLKFSCTDGYCRALST